MEKAVESRQDTAAGLGISVRMVDYLIAQGKLDAIKIGRRVMVKRKSIDALARNGCTTDKRSADEASAQ